MCPTLRIATLTICLALGLGKVAKAGQVDQRLFKRFQHGIAQIPKLKKHALMHVRVTAKVTNSEATVDETIKDYPPEHLDQLRKKGIDAKEYFRSKTFASEFALKDDSLLMIEDRPSGLHVISAKNEDYLFSISKHPIADNYSINWLSKVGDPLDTVIRNKIEHGSRNIHLGALACWTVFTETLDELIASDGFKLNAIKEIRADGTKYVRIDYERHEENFRYGGTVTDAYLVCDPGKQWALVEYSATLYNYLGKPFITRHVNHYYSHDNTNVPFVIKSVYVDNWLDNPERIDTIETTRELVAADPDDEIFHLSGYGLPEPKFESSFPTWLTYALAGVACLVVVFFWRRRQAGLK